MAHTHSRILLHVVFSTRGRRQLWTAQLRASLWPYMAAIARDSGAKCLAINGISDHVHLLLSLPPKLAIADVVRIIKANSSKWINESGPAIPFAWQEGYSVFSVSYSQEERVRRYIATQEEHHRQRTFEEELLSLLAKHAVDFDPRFVVD